MGREKRLAGDENEDIGGVIIKTEKQALELMVCGNGMSSFFLSAAMVCIKSSVLESLWERVSRYMILSCHL